MKDSSFYWAEEAHPSELPIYAREAWHREAWDREQDELGNLVGHDCEEHLATSYVTDYAVLMPRKAA